MQDPSTPRPGSAEPGIGTPRLHQEADAIQRQIEADAAQLQAGKAALRQLEVGSLINYWLHDLLKKLWLLDYLVGCCRPIAKMRLYG